jgi:hypothetical protein
MGSRAAGAAEVIKVAKRGRIRLSRSIGTVGTLRDVADSLDEDARRYDDVVQLNPGRDCAPQEWVRDVLRRHAKKLRRLALVVENQK